MKRLLLLLMLAAVFLSGCAAPPADITPEEIIAAYEDANHPGILWVFSVIFGDPSWRYCEAYGKIAVEYTEPKLFETFKDLMEGK